MYQPQESLSSEKRTQKILSEVLKINVESSTNEYEQSMRKTMDSLSANMLKKVRRILE